MIDLETSLEEQRTGQRRTTTAGPMAKTLPDLMRYRAILKEHPVDLLVETGTWTGASAVWFRQSGARHVVTIDTQPVGIDVPGSGVTFIHGSSVDPRVASEVQGLAHSLGAARVMVVLDSDHSAAHVLRELELYAPMVSPGHYLVVEDTIIHWMHANAGYEGSPWDAVQEWWARDWPSWNFVVNRELEDILPTTQHPGGWLQRVP